MPQYGEKRKYVKVCTFEYSEANIVRFKNTDVKRYR